MFNLFGNDFIDDIVKRMMSWIGWHNNAKLDRTIDLGIFCTLYQMNYCRNTGIYTSRSELVSDDFNTHFLFPGFDWTPETLRGELIKRFKEFQINNKLESIKKDFV